MIIVKKLVGGREVKDLQRAQGGLGLRLVGQQAALDATLETEGQLGTGDGNNDGGAGQPRRPRLCSM